MKLHGAAGDNPSPSPAPQAAPSCPLCQGRGTREVVDRTRTYLVEEHRDQRGVITRPRQMVPYVRTVACPCLLRPEIAAPEACGLGGLLRRKRLLGTDPADDVFDPSEMPAAQWHALQTWVDRLPYCVSDAENEETLGFVLAGAQTGCGKSHVAAALGHAARLAGVGVQFMTEREMLDQIGDTYGDHATEAASQVMARLTSIPLLILDDVGSSHARSTGGVTWYEDKMFQLLDTRLERKSKPTVLTTNLTPTGLTERLGPRSTSRLQRLSPVIFKGRDRRRRGGLSA